MGRTRYPLSGELGLLMSWELTRWRQWHVTGTNSLLYRPRSTVRRRERRQVGGHRGRIAKSGTALGTSESLDLRRRRTGTSSAPASHSCDVSALSQGLHTCAYTNGNRKRNQLWYSNVILCYERAAHDISANEYDPIWTKDCILSYNACVLLTPSRRKTRKSPHNTMPPISVTSRVGKLFVRR